MLTTSGGGRPAGRRRAVLAVDLLGPFRVSVHGRAVAVTAPRLRMLLAVMAMSAGRPVSVDRLAVALWGEDLPDDTRRSLRTYVTRLRGILGGDLVGTHADGYLLHAEPEQVDAVRFERLLDVASAASDRHTERDRLVAALALWRGTPFAGVRSAWLEQVEAPRLIERRLAAVERRIDLDIEDGRHTELVAELLQLTAAHPLREPLWARLLVVLGRSGRAAEALAGYETVRARLADELGAGPSAELRRAHADLLAATAPRPADPAPPAATEPRQLPADLDVFAGRTNHLETLNALLPDPRRPGPAAVLITSIAGSAGVGKTTLAVHWAHQVVDRFPDGQLYVDLRGFGARGPNVEPARAIRAILEAVGLPPKRIPADPDALVAFYRSMLAGKEMLIVLDNAHEAEQVRPLLPGTPGCFVIVTSRNQLSSLVVIEGARQVIVDVLPHHEAWDLLARRIGQDRLAAERDAVDAIIARCARLPLALAIAAARAVAQPHLPLASLAAELTEAGRGLDVWAGDDPLVDVRSVFSWSYRTLDLDTARLFRLLGLHPGPDIGLPAAASLAGVPLRQAGALLADLERACLVTEHAPGRYALHDLLHAYAAELARTQDDDTERRAAVDRMRLHYAHTAHAAALLLNPHRDRYVVDLPSPRPGVVTEELTGDMPALAWFGREHQVLLAVIRQSEHPGLDPFVGQLAWTMAEFFDVRGHWHDWAATQQLGLEAALRMADRSRESIAYRGLGRSHLRLGRFEEAHTRLRQALELSADLGDPLGQAHVHMCLSPLFEQQGEHRAALASARQALDLYRVAGNQWGQARALNSTGWCLSLVDEHEEALGYCEQAIALLEELGDRHRQAHAWDSLGYAHQHLGHSQQAINSYRRALALFSSLGDSHGEADTLTHLGDAQAAAGDHAGARRTWRQALAILDELAHPDADGVRAKLRAPVGQALRVGLARGSSADPQSQRGAEQRNGQ